MKRNDEPNSEKRRRLSELKAKLNVSELARKIMLEDDEDYSQADDKIEGEKRRTKGDTIIMSKSDFRRSEAERRVPPPPPKPVPMADMKNTMSRPASDFEKRNTMSMPASDFEKRNTMSMPASDFEKRNTMSMPASDSEKRNTMSMPASDFEKKNTMSMPASDFGRRDTMRVSSFDTEGKNPPPPPKPVALNPEEAERRNAVSRAREQGRRSQEKRPESSPAPRRPEYPDYYDSDYPAPKKKMVIRNKGRFILCIVCLLIVVAAIVGAVLGITSNKKEAKLYEEKMAQKNAIVAEATTLAAMYDYDAAIELLKTVENYESDEDVTAMIAQCEETKSTLVPYPVDQVTHIFFHALLVEPEVSFSDTSPMVDGFNIYMTTLDEFNDIIQSMYDKGYVLVSIYDVAQAGADGTFEAGTIMLPPGKKAFVLSEDDVCYYHAYENGGIADKLVIDEKTGKVKAQYTKQDGTVEVGDFDVAPALDAFIEKHPDFSYKGAKGILALTGYNGILGYRTDTTYDDASADSVDRDIHQKAWLSVHPDFDFESECNEAKRVVQALKDDGWLFASHSWGHKWQSKIGTENFAVDTQKWMTRVAPLIGGTDIWIYSNGEDVDTEQYQDRFKILQDNGFKYFCTVNSVQYSTRIDSYGLNQGRRNIDGYRMYYDMINDSTDKLSDLFDVNAVFDKRRPTPVPQI